MKAPASSKEITKIWIEYMLTEYETKSKPGVKVIVNLYDVKSATKPGESYNADLVTLDVKAKLKHPNGDVENNQNEEIEYNLIVKFLSQEPFNREMVKITKYHQREFVMYSSVMEDINKFQEERTNNKYSLHIPKFIYGKCTNSEYVIVMENVKHSNYEVIPKIRGLNYDEAYVAVEHLARLHAVSYAYNVEHNFLEKYPCFKFSPEISRFFKSVVYGSVENCIRFLHSQTDNEYKEIVEKLEKGKQSLPSKFSAMWDDQTRHKILCLTHGDFWISNLLFRYHKVSQDGNRNVESLKIIDWQISQWNNPLMDLHYLINTSTTLEFRNESVEEIVVHYHKVFTNALNDFKCPILNWDYQTFKAEFDRTSLVGFLMGMCLIQGTLSDAGEHLYSEPPSLQYPCCVPCKWVYKNFLPLIAKIVVPIAFKPRTEFLLRKSVQRFLNNIGDELVLGNNEVLNKRMLDLIHEARDKGLFDVMAL